MMWMALAIRLFTAINRTVAVIFMAVNPERCVSEGDVPRGFDPNPLISVYSSLILGLAIRARDGTSRKAPSPDATLSRNWSDRLDFRSRLHSMVTKNTGVKNNPQNAT